MLVIPSAIGVILILVGIALFIADLHVISHGLLTVGGIITLLAGGLALLGAGVPYSGVLLGVLVVVAMLMGGVLFGVLGSLRSLRGSKALTGKEGMLGEVGTVRSPVGVDSSGWCSCTASCGGPCLLSPRGDRPTRWRAHDRGGKQGERSGFR
jgi:membrane-bound ClpP family serine protease